MLKESSGWVVDYNMMRWCVYMCIGTADIMLYTYFQVLQILSTAEHEAHKVLSLSLSYSWIYPFFFI